MEALLETTEWNTAHQPNHLYLMDGSNCIAYIRSQWKNDGGCSEPFYFKKPLPLDRRYRTFRKVSLAAFPRAVSKDRIISVQGKTGTYKVNVTKQTCSCMGFSFRGTCKHLGMI